MYSKVAVKFQKFDDCLLFSDLSVPNSPIVGNIFIKKSTFTIILGELSSIYDEVEIELELSPEL
jgi:hypothetical protein